MGQIPFYQYGKAPIVLSSKDLSDMFSRYYQDTLRPLFGRQPTHTGRIAIVGIGGAGGNAIDTLMEEGIDGADGIAINTDAQVLATNQADTCLQVERDETRGLGAGADPEVGARAVEASRKRFRGCCSRMTWCS